MNQSQHKSLTSRKLDVGKPLVLMISSKLGYGVFTGICFRGNDSLADNSVRIRFVCRCTRTSLDLVTKLLF